MANARNEHPLHSHDDETEPWTVDTLTAHLQSMHGADKLPEGAVLKRLALIHGKLNHGEPAKAADMDSVLLEALAPERRYESITMGEPRNGYPGDQALFFASMYGNGTNIVNLRPGDMPLLRAAVIPDGPDLESRRLEWIGRLGPGAGPAVTESHAAGYRLAVQDMEAVRSEMSAAEQADDYLAVLQDEELPDGTLDAIEAVRALISARREAGKAAARG
jgi:hypothetical protein